MMRRTAPLVLGLSLALALTACSGSPAENSGPKRTTMTIAQSAAAQTFAPTFTDGSQTYLLSIYDTLTGIEPDGTPTPDLAKSWDVSTDGLKVTFHLESGVKFHDGSPLTSADVAYSMKWLLDPVNAQNLGPRFAAFLSNLATPDDTTVVFTLKTPAPGLFYLLSEFLIINEAAMGNVATTGAGSGPFVVKSSVPGTSFTLAKNPNYFKKGQPTVDTIVVKTIADPEAQYAALQSGTIDMIYAASDQTALQVKGKAGFAIEKAAMGAINPYLMMNTSRAPFNNKLVREAIAHAVNRDAMVKVAYPGGSSIVNCQPFAPDSPFFVPKFDGAACDYDIAKAKDLLKQAGFATGFSTTINVSANYGPPGTIDMAQILQADLAKIGVKLTVNTLDGAVARDKLTKSDFDMVIHSYSASNADPTFFVPSRTFGPVNGFSTFQSPALTSIIGKASVENDEKARKAQYKSFAELVSDEAYIVQISSASVLYVTKSDVKNVGSDISGWPILKKVTLGGTS